MHMPDRGDIAAMDEAMRMVLNRTASGKARDAALARCAKAAARAVHRAIGNSDASIDLFDRGRTVPDFRLRARDVHGGHEIARVRLLNGGAHQAVAELAMLMEHHAAVVAFSRARQAADTAQDGRGWRGSQPLHPFAFVLEHVMGRDVPRGQGRTATTKILRPLLVDGEPSGRSIAMIAGTPDVAWGSRRPTRIEIQMGLPDTLVHALVNTRLCDFMSVSLPEHQQASYDALTISGARSAGSKTKPRVDLELAPAMQVPRDPPPTERDHPALRAAWATVTAACASI